ncbi:paxillin-like isoform X2 [Ctenocephalides felis]|uniref:paxillin-like isoform X2 n=1 Tax=Ctenocephalides felis TaxID=7515 RepID=UPI000E6E11DA|nr:paxillin-like isoform X2 [Ctenocephalides felis]
MDDLDALLADLQNTVPGSINKGQAGGHGGISHSGSGHGNFSSSGHGNISGSGHGNVGGSGHGNISGSGHRNVGGAGHGNVSGSGQATCGYGSLNAPRVITSPHTVQPLSSYQSHSRQGSGSGSAAFSYTGGSTNLNAGNFRGSINHHGGSGTSGHHGGPGGHHTGNAYDGTGNSYGTTTSPSGTIIRTVHYDTPAMDGDRNSQVKSPVQMRSRTPSVPEPRKTPSSSHNLSELDSLLQDLSNAHYASIYDKDRSMNGTASPIYTSPNGTLGPRGSLDRPSVDSLLQELNSAAPIANSTMNYYANGDSPRPGKQVTTTVRETKTIEPMYAATNQQNQGQRPAPNEDVFQGVLFSETNRPPNSDGLPFHSERMTTHMVRKIGAAPAASSATRELDDLMASLSDFKITSSSHQHQTVTESSKSVQTITHKDQLDSMLGNLQADMSRQGVNTAQKGSCGACDKAIVGQVITALGKTWHPEHFVCNHCNQELGTRNFFERDGHPYCEPDYHNLFSPRCAYCNGAILDKCVTALEKTWHTEHFFCAQCGQQFGEEGFHEKDGKPYCRNDYFDMFAPKCGGCNRPIMENYISALNSQWHPDCFVCRDCKKPVSGKSFYAMEGKPVCPKCVGVEEEDE